MDEHDDEINYLNVFMEELRDKKIEDEIMEIHNEIF